MFFFTNKKKNMEATKKALLKEFFNAGSQKKMITQAARESAKDQDKILKKYKLLVRPN